jgi:lipoyl(octanoyl) transferase
VICALLFIIQHCNVARIFASILLKRPSIKQSTHQQIVKYQWLSGQTYASLWDYQTGLHKALVAEKLAQRHLADEEKVAPIHHLLLCEHHHVYTLGKSGTVDHLLIDEAERAEHDIEYFKINRGGDITYHGPGQITGYPILDLDWFFTDVHKYVRYLEQAVIDMLATFGIKGDRIEGFTGVWLPPAGDGLPWRKICAIGVHLSRWVTMHGFALNVNTDLAYFNKIVPCGIVDPDKAVTSMAAELGRDVDMRLVADRLKTTFAALFGFTFLQNDQ